MSKEDLNKESLAKTMARLSEQLRTSSERFIGGPYIGDSYIDKTSGAVTFKIFLGAGWVSESDLGEIPQTYPTETKILIPSTKARTVTIPADRFPFKYIEMRSKEPPPQRSEAEVQNDPFWLLKKALG